MKYFLHFVFVSTLLWSSTASAQSYSGQGCSAPFHTTLKSEFQKGLVSPQEGIAYAFYEKWSSSYLKSKMPPKTAATEMSAEDEEALASKQDQESCRFTVMSLTDNNTKTAWCEGAEGAGVGEVAVVLSAFKPNFKVKNGFGKSGETYVKNGRIKKMRVIVFSSNVFSKEFTGSESNAVPELKKVFAQDVALQDIGDWQDVALTNPPSSPDAFYTLGFEILEVYPGTQYQDTCVSEIRAEGDMPSL